MNQQISRVAIVSLLLLASLIAATTYWQVWAAPGLSARQDNAIQLVAQFQIRRGLIYASDGKTVLAENVAKKSGSSTLSSARTRRRASRRRPSATPRRAAPAPASSARRTPS